MICTPYKELLLQSSYRLVCTYSVLHLYTFIPSILSVVIQFAGHASPGYKSCVSIYIGFFWMLWGICEWFLGS